jgi:hypothetical protein
MAPTSFRRVTSHFTGSTHPFLVPIGVVLAATSVVVGILAWTTAVQVRDGIDCRELIPVDAANSGIFSSADDRPDLYPAGGRIEIGYPPSTTPPVLGLDGSIAFTFAARPTGPLVPTENGGVFVTFYGDPIEVDRFAFLEFAVLFETEDTLPQEADLLVRLTLDDTEAAPSEREIVVRQSRTLQELGIFVRDRWQVVQLDLLEFNQFYFPQSPEGANVAEVNKIAFVIDGGIAGRLEGGSVRISDIAFGRRQGTCDVG